MTKTAEELYQEREKRVLDAIALRKPDRVPILPLFSFFVARYTGMSIQEVMNDPEKLFDAQWKTLTDFQPDMDNNPYNLRFLGPILDVLDFKQLLWPGHGLNADHTYQFVEGEYMTADEYDHFLLDPLDFMMRKYWPRIMGGLKGLEKLPPLHNIISYYMGIPTGFAMFTLPEVQSALETLRKAGEKSLQIISYASKYTATTKSAGYPMQFGGATQAPFDTLGDFYRGTKGLMLDMFRRPDKVEQACERLLSFMIEMGVNAAKASGVPRIFIPLHKGLDGFMSEEQFRRFFWPTLRALMMALIDQGLTPCPLWEGDCTSRLEIIKDIPPGKAIYAFEATDMAKAKTILGDTVCLRGNLPISILATGNSDDVRAHCKRLIDEAGRDGGYIMDASTGVDDAKPENLRAMFEFTREYGVY
ncbi:MAG: uroporphyrinogen decarboxylase family protein [Syntrophorhabdales bacterium]